MRDILFYVDWRLLGTLVLFSVPVMLVAGILRFGSLGQFVAATLSLLRTPKQVAEDTARSFLTLGSRLPSRLTNPSPEARIFWLVYWFVILAVYTIVRNITRS